MAVVLERLDSLRDAVRLHGLQPRSQGDRATERAGEAPDPRYEDSSRLRAPPADRERYEDPYDEQQLESLLGSPEFRDGVWPRMDGTFQMASAHLCGFLASQGFPEPGVEPHPPLVRGEGNHWDFLVVRARRAGEEGRRFLVPRNYSRYDPAMHDHLFDVLGRGASLESFVRELRRCAVLRGSGDLGELIRPELLARKGVFVV
jgi:hypothetical protein